MSGRRDAPHARLLEDRIWTPFPGRRHPSLVDHQGGGADGDRVRRHGVRRLLRQAHLHPHQQHHRRLRLDGKHHFVGSCLANVYSNVATAEGMMIVLLLS
uniref:Uncharacterized protein n=1 Tax=Triticum urartu TaxID=4572 RepID=A0A8R7U0F9_TRIUA